MREEDTWHQHLASTYTHAQVHMNLHTQACTHTSIWQSFSVHYFVCIFFFIRHFLYLYFKWYPISWFRFWNPPILSPHACSPNHTLLFLSLRIPYNGTQSLHRNKGLSSHWWLARPSSATYGLEPWVPPCVLFGWWFSPWELWGYRLVHIVVPPVRLQTPSAPLVLSLTPPFGTLCSVQWLTEST